MPCGCGGCCGGKGGCFGQFKKKAFEGLPYDSKTYYAGDMARQLGVVRSEFSQMLTSGGVRGVSAEPWMIKMEQLFSEKRDYLVIKYHGVNIYVLMADFGNDLYVSWISFFKLGCLDRIKRFGVAVPNDYDVDDLNMLGSDVDLCVRTTLDNIMQQVGAGSEKIEKVLSRARKKSFVKA